MRPPNIARTMAMDCISHMAFVLTLLLAVNDCAYSRAIDDLDNTIDQAEQSIATGREWVQISEAPPSKVEQTIGSQLELECEVTGSPVPTVHWIRGNKFESDLINDYSSNLIPESSPNSLVRIRSRLIIDVNGATEKSYTCVGQSGTKTAYATTTVYSNGPSKNIGRINAHNITDLMAINHRINSPKKPRIVLYYSVIFEEIGSNVVLPCKAAGRPHPEVYWLDTNENIVNGQDPRIRMLPSGELLITYLRWSDMGTFTCVAHNAIAKDAVATFVYPVLNDA